MRDLRTTPADSMGKVTKSMDNACTKEAAQEAALNFNVSVYHLGHLRED